MSISLSTIKMTDGSSRLKFESPFHPDLPARLRALGGKWNAERRVWYLPADLEIAARELCVEFFAVDPLAETPVERVTLHLNISNQDIRSESLWLVGREILRRPGRDAAVRPGDGVSIIGGGFARSGGSRNYPSIGCAEDRTVLIIRDVPRPAAEALIAENPNARIADEENA